MARPLRIEYPGAVHHPTARDKNSTFKTPALRGSRMDFSALSLCTSACVDGPCIARKIYLIAISVGCAHVSGLLMRYYNRWPWWNSRIWFQSFERARSAWLGTECPYPRFDRLASSCFLPLQNTVRLPL